MGDMENISLLDKLKTDSEVNRQVLLTHNYVIDILMKDAQASTAQAKGIIELLQTQDRKITELEKKIKNLEGPNPLSKFKLW